MARSLRPLIVALAPGQQRSLNRLKAMRIEVSNELAEVVREFGPQLYENYDDVSVSLTGVATGCSNVLPQLRVSVPSASVPPSSGQPGIWRRKSATGGVDAQGNLLIHPMVCGLVLSI